MLKRLGLPILLVPFVGSSAQLPPVHPLGPITASAIEVFGTTPSLRALSGGRVLVSDPVKQRLVLFDTTLRNATVVLDASSSANGALYPAPGRPPARGGGLIAAPGDTTYFLDLVSSSFVVIDGSGKLRE
jgi:hypothetical protein